MGREPLVSCRARDIMLDTEASPQTPGASAPSRRILCIGGCDPLLTARTQDRSLRRTTHDCSYRSACLTGFVGSLRACQDSLALTQAEAWHVLCLGGPARNPRNMWYAPLWKPLGSAAKGRKM